MVLLAGLLTVTRAAVNLYPPGGKTTGNVAIFMGQVQDSTLVSETFVFPLSYKIADALQLSEQPETVLQSVKDALFKAGVGEYRDNSRSTHHHELPHSLNLQWPTSPRRGRHVSHPDAALSQTRKAWGRV